MKKIFSGLIILFFTTFVFAEMQQTVKVGEVAKFGYGLFPIQENVITGVRKEGNLIYLNVATKEKNSYSHIYLQYVFENNEVAPFRFYFWDPETKTVDWKNVRVYTDRNNEVTFISVD